MDPDFEFDVGCSDDDLVVPVPSRTPKSQSAWDFAAYSESVAEEHARRNTTSVDAKISNALRERQVPLPDDDAEDEYESGDEGDGDVVEDEVVEAEEKRGKKEKVKPGKGSAVSDGNETRKDKFFASSEGATFHADSFINLNLSRPLLRACEALGYHTPTPIQSACVPLALTGRDICGSAITGSGKTAAFTLPVLERLLYRPKRINAIRVLILTPTRELAAQVHSMVEKLAQFTDIRCCLVVGGLSTKEQEKALRSMPDIVIATPGRIIDHLRNSLSVGLEDLAVLILDEADRLLEFGFSSDISELIRQCPKRRQTMLFSATMTEEVGELVKLSMSKPVRLEADPSAKRPALLTEEIIRIRRMREVNQEAVLLALCSKTFTHKVIIFSGTKQAAHRLKIIFGLAGLKATELHGNLTQAQRLDALELFRRQEVDFLIATDVAARGLDIVGVQTVINFACPRDLTSYIHRVGRTARAGREGYAVTFVTDNDRSLVKSIAKKAGSQLKSRIVAQRSIIEWSETIEQMEDQISNVLQDESTERIIRKADMEASKAENMINRKDDIFSRPKRTWHVSEREKKLVAEAAKQAALGKSQTGVKQVLSAQQAEDFKMKEKRQREREKNLPRKKRRRLEAKREMVENEDDSDQEQGNKKEKSGKSVTDLAYQRAKAIKAKNRKSESGRTITKPDRTTKGLVKKQNRKEEMQELFQSDMSEKKQFRASKKGGDQITGKKNSKSFNSKKRYKRR